MNILRHPHNPILRPQDVTPSSPRLRVTRVFNGAPFRFRKQICLLLRVSEEPALQKPGHAPLLSTDTVNGRYQVKVKYISETDPHYRIDGEMIYKGRLFYLTHVSHLRLARSDDGIHFSVDPKPTFTAQGPLEASDIEDARVVRLGSTYYINYSSVSIHGVSTSLASTRDFKTFRRHGCIMPCENRNIAIFPQKIGRYYYALQRPSRWTGGPEMWVMRSPDLLHWGGHQHLIDNRPGRWDAGRVGATGTPIKTPQGWLVIYHGKRNYQAHGTYSLGAILLDLKNPARVLARTAQPILSPKTPYEGGPTDDGIVFSNGQIVDADGKVWIYYGSGDRTLSLATTTVADLLQELGVKKRS
ncbi:MAG: hypothetical protein IT443_02185 [Phycisphaeraceae bacterium]|nr:hypothetical protein [Phycisphaeraceae bacterium]